VFYALSFEAKELIIFILRFSILQDKINFIIMIIQLSNLPNNILGFDFTGEVTNHDYESVVYPVLESYSKQKNKIRILCQFDKSFQKFDLGAIWDDTVISIKHFLDWEKVAIVSDLNWLNHTFKALGFLMPGHLRTYSNSEREKAIKWLSSDSD
jgi:hypothetical protein